MSKVLIIIASVLVMMVLLGSVLFLINKKQTQILHPPTSQPDFPSLPSTCDEFGSILVSYK